jgi:RNA-directed DNA polymerase
MPTSTDSAATAQRNQLRLDSVEETDENGNKHRSTRNRDEGKGTPQGAPISPLLSNLYMRRFVLGWKKLGHEKRLAAYIVNYADDLVICCRGRAEEALARMRDIMTKLKLTVNETKTRVCKLPEEKFDFLGYTFGRCYSPKTGRAYMGTVPSKKRVIRICEAISEMTGRDQTLLEQEIVVAKLNRTMIGWANYFCLGPVSNAYRAVENHACKRLRQVVVCQAQSDVGDHAVFEGLPTQRAGSSPPYQAAAPFPV